MKGILTNAEMAELNYEVDIAEKERIIEIA